MTIREDIVERELASHTESINTVKFTKDGSFCMTASNDRSVKLWNPHRDDPHSTVQANNKKSALLIQTYAGSHGYEVKDIAIATDNSKFASVGGDKACFVTDVATGRTLRRIQAHNAAINTVDLNDDSTVLTSGSYDQTVCMWDLRASNRDPLQVLRDFKDSVTSLVHTSSSIIVGSIDSTIHIYDLRKGLCHKDDLCAAVVCLRLTSDEKCVLCTCLDSTVRLVDLQSGSLLNDFRGGHTNHSYKLEACVASDDQHILVGSEDGSLCHYNILTSKVSRITLKAHSKCLSAIAHHPKDPVFLTASYDGIGRFWSRALYS